MSNPTAIPGTAPASERVRAFYAPVRRDNGTPTPFDPAAQGRFSLDAPPTGWIDLGWVHDFKRASETKVEALQSGAPLLVRGQTRKQAGAEVALSFDTCGNFACFDRRERIRCGRSCGRRCGLRGTNRLCRCRRERCLCEVRRRSGKRLAVHTPHHLQRGTRGECLYEHTHAGHASACGRARPHHEGRKDHGLS